MNLRLAALALPVALGLACGRNPAAPISASTANGGPMFQHQRDGSGLVLESITGLTLPLIGQLGDVVIDQAVLTNFVLVEDVLGNIVGLEAEGVVTLTGGVLGTDVVTENFLTTVSVASSGPGQCGIVTLDLAPFDVDLLVAQVDLPAAAVDVRGSGAVGPLLCALGSLTNPVTQVVRGIVQALNRLI